MGYTNGDYVVCRGQGLARVQRVERDGTVVLQLSVDDADTLEVPTSEVDKRLRAAVDKAAADKLVALLTKRDGKPDARPWGEQYVDIQKALRKGDAKPLAERLQQLLRNSAPLPSAVERALFSLEDALLPELAHALANPVSRLRTRIRNGQPAFAYQDSVTDIQPAVVPKPDKLPKGWEHLGYFHLSSGKIVAGEIGESDIEATFAGKSLKLSLTLKAKKGAWHALKPPGNAWAGVFVHRDAAAVLEKQLKAARELGKVSLEHATFCVLDEALLEDRSFQRSAALNVNQSVEGRGFVVAAEDGPCPVRVAYEGSEALLLAVPRE
jgi:RNA polymerase-interacting CarD/CdnL/TRCF family regulator